MSRANGIAGRANGLHADGAGALSAGDDTRRVPDRRLMGRLLGYLRPYRGQVALAVLVALADAIIGLAGPWLTKEAIDHGIRHHDPVHLDRVAVLYLTTLLAGFVFAYYRTQIMQRVGQSIRFDLRMALFRTVQRLPLATFDRTPIGGIATRLGHDVDVLDEFFGLGLVSIVSDVFLLTGIVVAMIRLNAELLAVTFSVLPLIVVVTLLFRVPLRRAFRDVRQRLAALNAALHENLAAVTTIQLLHRERVNAEAFRALDVEHRDAALRAASTQALLFPALELVGAIAVSLIVWYGGRQVMWTGITLGTLVAFLQYTQRFFRPVSDLSDKVNVLQQAMTSAERVFELLDAPADPAAAATPHVLAAPAESAVLAPPTNGSALAPFGAPAADAARGTIEFEHVWFAYAGEHWVLEDVSFTVGAGERVALVGTTGAGKSTLVSLLLRFYTPQRGTIRVDGVPIEQWDARALRESFGVVLQDVFLFSGTIESNLRLGAAEIAPEELDRAVRDARADAFIDALPGGYAAPVTERGATLSAGQRQLVSFARALARAPHRLILDEATSAVDTLTERCIQQALERLLEGRTSLVIAHRVSTIRSADRIVVLHRGRVRGMGGHAELLRRGGIYARLYELSCLGLAAAATMDPERPAQGPKEPSQTPSESQIVDRTGRLA